MYRSTAGRTVLEVKVTDVSDVIWARTMMLLLGEDHAHRRTCLAGKWNIRGIA